MTTRYDDRAARAADELAALEERYGALSSARGELQRELDALSAAANANPDSLSAADVIDRARAATRLSSDGAALRQAIKKIDRDLEKLGNDLYAARINAMEARGLAALAASSQRARLASLELAVECDALLALWPSGAGHHSIVGALRDARKGAGQLTDALAALAGPGPG